MSKLSNVTGRIDYITSAARQENLYATYNTTDKKYWSLLARENQQEFKRSGTTGTCIEARELIIALPEIYTKFEPQQVLEEFTDFLRTHLKLNVYLLCIITRQRRIIIYI